MGCTRHADVTKAVRKPTHNWQFGSLKAVGVLFVAELMNGSSKVINATL